MKLIRYAVLAAGLTLAAAAHSQTGALAKVNGVTIPQSRADILIKEMTGQGRPDTPEMRGAIKQERVKVSGGSREYKARHILVETEDEAKQINDQVKKGASFEKLSGEKSKDQ